MDGLGGGLWVVGWRTGLRACQAEDVEPLPHYAIISPTASSFDLLLLIGQTWRRHCCTTHCWFLQNYFHTPGEKRIQFGRLTICKYLNSSHHFLVQISNTRQPHYMQQSITQDGFDPELFENASNGSESTNICAAEDDGRRRCQ
jgi:hypothetical protein